MSKTSKQVSLSIWTDRSDYGSNSRYAHIHGRLCETELSSDGYPHIYRYAFDTPLAGFAFSAQSDNDSFKREPSAHWYAHRIGLEAECDIATLELAQRAVRVLAPVEKRIEKMGNEEGYAESMAHWVNRIARAVGCKSVFIRVSKETEQRTGIKYKSVNVGIDLIHELNRIEQDLNDAWNPQLRAVA